MSEDWRPLIRDTTSLCDALQTCTDREEFRSVLNALQRKAAYAALLIDQEIIRELKDLRRAMPEHGFTGQPDEPSPKAATIEDLLA